MSLTEFQTIGIGFALVLIGIFFSWISLTNQIKELKKKQEDEK